MDIRFGPRYDLSTHLKTFRMQDVALFAIHIMDQGNIRTPIRVVLNGSNIARDSDFISSKINPTIAAFMTTATTPRSYPAVVVPAPRFFQWFEERFLWYFIC